MALVAPTRRSKARLYALSFPGAIHGEEVVVALRYFRRAVGRPLYIVWDRLQAHRSRKVSDFLERHLSDFHVEYLPPYAPDLNPEEGCNSAVKADMRNLSLVGFEHMRREVRASFRRLQRRPQALRGFIRHAGLRLN